tara:strand:- start:490 stop:612 length:123 start_codon:yes stop_codon:yes gene_type:complete
MDVVVLFMIIGFRSAMTSMPKGNEDQTTEQFRHGEQKGQQ